MTANEAIKILEVAKAECEWNAPLDYQEAFDLAISALREQNLQPSCNQLATDYISRQAAIDAVAEGLKNTFIEYRDVAEKMIGKLPSAQTDSCNGCKWENAFGYGECHHCKRRYDDMYEVKDDE